MGTQNLIDSNAVIEFLGGMLPSAANNQLQNIVDLSSHYLSVINQIELLGFAGPAYEMNTLEAFIESCNVLSLSESVAQTTIDLRKVYRIKLPDEIIAATALVHNLVLITRNTSDFKMIQGLEVVNSHDLESI